MAQIKINIPGFGEHDGSSPIVILGPNGSGKTQLAQRISQKNQVSAISAQRRTWVDDSLPVQEENKLRNNINSYQNQWQSNSWQPTEEINYILSSLIQNHTNILTQRNEEALLASKPLEAVGDTNLIKLQLLWNRLFPMRKLEIGGFFPRVKRLDLDPSSPSYQLRQMSDGERSILYMAARVLTAEQTIVLVDEPEIHMHSRLAVEFWDEAEKLRPDCRFVYITHDLNFTLSRRTTAVFLTQNDNSAETILIDQIPSTVVTEVLGAATLPFYAKRIFMFEGELGKGFASEFFSIWFDGNETFAIPAGDRNAVAAAVAGLKTVGVVAAEVIGLIDRDFYSDAVLNAVTEGVTVLPLNEIESILCDENVIRSLAEHLGKNPTSIWQEFLDRVRKEFQGQTLNRIIAHRVRFRVGDLLDGAFNGAQIVPDLKETSANHVTTLSSLDLFTKTESMFIEESKRVTDALTSGGQELLALLPGKHLLSLLPPVLGLSSSSELTNLVMQSLNRSRLEKSDSLVKLGERVEAALLAYLPPRKAAH